MKETFTFGIIGAGMIALEHIKNLRLFPQAKLKWISAREEDKETLNSLKIEFQIPFSTTNYLDLLSDRELDAVIICTPPFTHSEIFINVLRAGKHVLLEKPACINSAELQKMLDEQEKHPELIVCDASCRHSRLQPKFEWVKNTIQSGVLGKIYFIHHNSVSRQGRPGIEYHPSAKWFLDKSKSGGGPLIDWGVYDLSFHLGILGDKHELISVDTFRTRGLDKADPGAPVFDVEEHAASLMQFSNKLEYYWERASHANMEVQNETRIYGTKGGLKFSYLTWESPLIKVYGLDEKNNPTLEEVSVDMSAHKNDGFELTRHFLNVLSGREKPASPLSLAARHLQIIFDLYEGGRGGGSNLST